MANGTDSHETPDARTIDVEQLMAAMSGLTQGQIEDVLQSLLAARAPLPRLFEATPPPSRRRPRRTDVVTYRARINVKGTRPPLWRRLELAYKRVVKRRGKKKTRPGRCRQLDPHHLLAPALQPRCPVHRPRPRLARPARTPAAQTPAHRRTRTPIRQEGPAPRGHRLTHPAA